MEGVRVVGRTDGRTDGKISLVDQAGLSRRTRWRTECTYTSASPAASDAHGFAKVWRCFLQTYLDVRNNSCDRCENAISRVVSSSH